MVTEKVNMAAFFLVEQRKEHNLSHCIPEAEIPLGLYS